MYPGTFKFVQQCDFNNFPNHDQQEVEKTKTIIITTTTIIIIQLLNAEPNKVKQTR